MLEVLRKRAEEQGIASRCVFHAGYLESLPAQAPFDTATSFLVSQFILEREVRSQFFQGIADRLRPGGMLISSDLALPADASGLLEIWFQVMSDSGSLPSQEEIEKMWEAYQRNVAVLPPQDVREIITLGGFDSPVLFFQAGMIHAWYAKQSQSAA